MSIMALIALTPSYGQATSSTQQFTVPFDTSGIPLCGGEVVRLIGTTNFAYHTTILPDGSSQIDQFHYNYMQVNAIGVSSGDSYVIREAGHGGSVQVGADTFQTTINGILVSLGSGTAPNTGVTLVFHTTLNANGQPTSDVQFLNVRCVG